MEICYLDYFSYTAWELFFDPCILTIIVNETNNNIRRKVGNPNMSEKHLKNNYLHETDEIEIRALLGLLYLRGCLNQTKHDVHHLFGLDGHQGFGATMSVNRFQFLLARLSFDDKLQRDRRWKTDRFSAIRDIFEQLNTNCAKYMAPEAYSALDETLTPTRVRSAFVQYNPRKPARYGILFRSINAITFRYTHSVIVMAGKPENTEDAHYYIPTVMESVKVLVRHLEKYQVLGGRTISTDQFYTGFPLTEWLLSHNIMTVGTIQKNRAAIPVEFKDPTGRENNSYQIIWEKENKIISAHSYVVKTKSKGKKNVLMLSSRPPQNGKVLVCKVLCAGKRRKVCST